LDSSKYVRAGKQEEVKRLEIQAEALSEAIDGELAILGLESGVRVLDVGCGPGAVTRKIAERVKPAEVLAIDIDPLFLEAAKKLAKSIGVRNVRFELGNAENLKYPDQTFDVCYCRLVLSHLENPSGAVSELRRVTKKGGLVASSDDGGAFYAPPLPKLDLLTKRMHRALFRSREKREKQNESIFSVFSSAGLESIVVQHIPIFASHQNVEKLRQVASVPLKMLQVELSTALGAGVLSKEEFEDVVEEFQSWLKDPTAFWMVLSTLTVGRVPR